MTEEPGRITLPGEPGFTLNSFFVHSKVGSGAQHLNNGDAGAPVKC